MHLYYITMRTLLIFCSALVVLGAVAAQDTTRDDLFVLHQVHEEFADGGERDAWAHVLALVREAERSDVRDVHAEFESLLTADVHYVAHGRGECRGRAQTIECLRNEEQRRAHTPTGGGGGGHGTEHHVSAVREGRTHVVRVLQIHRERDGDLRRLLDVYFVHFAAGADTRVSFVEHLPTVVEPIRFTWSPPVLAAEKSDSD